MNIRDELEQIRRELNIPDYQMCNIFDMSLEEFRRYRSNMRQGPGTYGLIMFVIETRRPLKTIEEREKHDTRKSVAGNRHTGGEQRNVDNKNGKEGGAG